MTTQNPNNTNTQDTVFAAFDAAKDAIVEAVLLCDFSQLFASKFRVGDSTQGLAAIVQAKQELLRVSPPDNDRFCRRAIAQLENRDIEAARQTLLSIVTRPR